MMKTRLILTIMLLTAVLLPVRAQDSLTAQADSAYTADNFQEAAELYLQALHTDGASAELLYNLGNCYYRLGRPGQAIVNYERALRLDPSMEDARFNRDFVNARIADRPGERGTFLSNALDAAALSVRSDSWAWIAFGCFCLTLLGAGAYAFSSVVGLRKLGFFGGLTALIATAVFVFLAYRCAALCVATDAAVVVSPSTILSTSPRTPTDRSQEAMLLHEGTKLKILDSVRSTTDSVAPLWYDVEIDNAHRAWIDARAVEKI